MDEVLKVAAGLQITLPSIDYEQLLALESPSATFEQHIPADVGLDYWLYSVNGNLVNGEPILVRASKFLPGDAEDLAQEGLAFAIKSLRNFDANTGLHAQVEVKGLQ